MRGIRLDCPKRLLDTWGKAWLKAANKIPVPAPQVQQQMPEQGPQEWGPNWGSTQYEPHYTMQRLHLPPPWRLHQDVRPRGEPRPPQMSHGSFIPRKRSAASTAPIVSPAWPEARINDETDSDGSTPVGSPCVEQVWNTEASMKTLWDLYDPYPEPQMKMQRTSDEIIEEPQMKKQRTPDDVAVKQEQKKDSAGGFFRCSQARDNPQPPWLTSLLVGKVLPSPLFVFC